MGVGLLDHSPMRPNAIWLAAMISMEAGTGRAALLEVAGRLLPKPKPRPRPVGAAAGADKREWVDSPELSRVMG